MRNAGRTYYLYDGEKPVLEENNAGVKTAVTTFGPSGVLARTDATRTLLYTFDPMGNLSQQIVAGTGVIAATHLLRLFRESKGHKCGRACENVALGQSMPNSRILHRTYSKVTSRSESH